MKNTTYSNIAVCISNHLDIVLNNIILKSLYTDLSPGLGDPQNA
jgi:hypothetical protein